MDTVSVLNMIAEELAVSRKASTQEKESFGKRLARLRKQAGFSQRALAQEIGISQRMLAYYETRALKPPVQILPTLAEVLGVSVDVLLGTERSPKRKPPAVNQRLLAKLRKIESLPKRDQQTIMRTIEAFLGKAS
jgi:transcriptional regulator with XRE-family HTH domain